MSQENTEKCVCSNCNRPAIQWARDQIETKMGKNFYLCLVDEVTPEGFDTINCRCLVCGRVEVVWRSYRIAFDCPAEQHDPLQCENCLENNRVSPYVELAWPPWSAEAREAQERRARESFEKCKKFLKLKREYAEEKARRVHEEKEARANALAEAKQQEPRWAEELKTRLMSAIEAHASFPAKKTVVSMARSHVFKFPKKQTQLFSWICEGRKLLEKLAA